MAPLAGEFVWCGVKCGPCWTRTNDSLLKRQVLYRLS
jgi:hypothetical protein